jgi:beta-galactosidase
VLTEPFAVRDNREMLAAELLLVYDPTPATWYWSWDREVREDAKFAASLDAVYRVQPTSQDAGIMFLADSTLVPFPCAPPAHDTWDVTLRFISNMGYRLKLIGTVFVGQTQPTGCYDRLITRAGGELKLRYRSWLLTNQLRFNDWGPYDYQRDFNLTFPVQWYGDLGYTVTSFLPRWLGTRVGLRAQVRTLDANSGPSYLVDMTHPNAIGLEYEIGAYVHLSL